MDKLTERDKLCEESFQLLYQISRKTESEKLLGLARNHLKVDAEYESSNKIPEQITAR